MGIAVMSNSVGWSLKNKGVWARRWLRCRMRCRRSATPGTEAATMAQALNDLAGALAKAGRGKSPPKLLEEAQGLARDLKNDALSAQPSEYRRRRPLLSGRSEVGEGFYQQAQRVASHGSDKDGLLTSKLNLAKVAVSEGHSQAAAADLRALGSRLTLSARNTSLWSASHSWPEALIENKDYRMPGRSCSAT